MSTEEKSNHLENAFAAVRARERRRSADVGAIMSRGTVLQAHVLVEGVLAKAKENNQDWIAANQNRISQRFPDFSQVSGDALSSAFVTGLHRLIKQEYTTLQPEERRRLLDPDYLAQLLQVYTRDYVKGLVASLEAAIPVEKSVEIAAIIATRYDAGILKRLQEQIAASGTGYSLENIIGMRLPNPEGYLASLIDNKSSKAQLAVLLRTEYPDIPQHIINSAVAKYKDPRPFLAKFGSEVERLRGKYTFVSPEEYPFPSSQYPDWVYQAALDGYAQPDIFLRQLATRIRTILHEYKEFRGLEIGVFVKAIIDHKDFGKQIEFLTQYTQKHPISLAREIQVEVMAMLGGVYKNGPSTRELLNNATTKIQARRPDLAMRVADYDKMETLFGIQLLKLREAGLIRGEGASKRSFTYVCTNISETRVSERVIALINTIHMQIADRLHTQDTNTIATAVFTRTEERELFALLDSLPNGLEGWNRLRNVIAQHNKGLVIRIATNHLRP